MNHRSCVGNIATFGKISEELFDSIFDFNVKGLLFTFHKARRQQRTPSVYM